MFAGMSVAGARATAPSGWLVCDGTAYNEADYPALFAAIGAAFGDDGAGTFRVPDMRGRAPIGVGQGSGLTDRALAANGGAETHVLATTELRSHLHTIANMSTGQVQSGSGSLAYLFAIGQNTNTGNALSSSAHNNMSPWLALNFFIYAGQ